MGVDLRLSGLASGFDWKPVVEQLVQLESIPQARMASEKESNETKISELGILKSQLESLESAATTLQSDNIYDARKVVLGEEVEKYLTASVEIGTLTGEYKVSIHSLGTSSLLTSDTLKPTGVGKALDSSSLLANLPLQTSITPGTFTVESQTYEITASDLNSLTGKSLQDLLDSINADPENNGYPVTFEYDALEDRVIVDGGELATISPTAIPILGHPADTSNFLKVTRLLDGEIITRYADKDQFRDFDANQAWLRKGDPRLNTTNPLDPHGLPDERNFTFLTSNGIAYQRLADTTPDFFAANKLDYVINDEVYKDGFLYKVKKDFPTEVYFAQEGVPSVSDYYATRIDGGETIQITYDSGPPANVVDSVWELQNDPRTHTNTGIANPVDAWNAAADRSFRANDVVAVSDGGLQYYMQALQDSPLHQGASNIVATGHAYSSGDLVESPAASGMFHAATAAWDAVVTGGSAAHNANNRYSGGELLYGPSNVVYQATANWAGLLDHSPATNAYGSGDYVWDAANNSGAYTPNFSLYTLPINHAIAANDLVSDTSGPTPAYFKPVQAIADWAAGAYNQNDLVCDSNKFWKSDTNGNSTTPGAPGANWTEVTAGVANLTDPAYWSDVSVDVNNTTLASNSYWQAADFSDAHLWTDFNSNMIDATDPTYWGAAANINSSSVFDSNFWRTITPVSGGGFWVEIATVGPDAGADADVGTGDEAPLGNTDTNFWDQIAIPDPLDPVSGAQYWGEVTESYIRSSQALGAIDVSTTLASANWDGALAVNPDGTGSFFIGHGMGGVEIAYDTTTDTITELIERVNASDAKVTMSYDAVGDQFIVQSDVTGLLGITLNESGSWDSVNAGTGNLLELMGLVSDVTDGSAEVKGVGRAKTANLGENAIITVNGGDRIFSQSNVFDGDAHGVEGLTINLSKVTSGEVSFFVQRDLDPAKSALNKFVEEFNDAQQYISSLVDVTRDGDDVTAGRFSGNLEISRLGSRLRKLVFGSSYPHSASETTSDGTNKKVGDFASRDALSTNFDSDNDGYRIYIDNTGGDLNAHYQEWQQAAGAPTGSWGNFTPTFSSFRINDIGLDFQSGSDELYIENSALLAQELTNNPNKVKALFAEAKPDAVVYDHNKDQSRDYGGITFFLTEFIDNFIESDAGTYKTHLESLQNQNDRLDTSIADMERYLIQRESTLTQNFIRMEEMQSRMSSQMQTLQSSFPSN